MKQYLLSLRSSDFSKSNDVWTTQPINLYSNSSYKNYSTVRSAYGLNLIGDRTFTGLEVASPSVSGNHAIATDPNAVYVTDYGEVVYESATPNLTRFVDMTSQVDLLSFSHKFVNLEGNTEPTFSLVIYESDDENGPWLESYSSGEISTLFMRDVKKYIKIELEINNDEADLSLVGLLFFLEVGIHDVVPPVVSRTGKNILRRFPTWTKIHEDSIDSATPSLDIPQSEGGKFVTAIVQDSFNFFENVVDINSINSHINTADENQIAWVYATYFIPAAESSFVYGDDVRLAPVASLNKMLSLKSSDYVYYYNAVDRSLYTTRKFDRLVVNNLLRTQDPVNIFNDFDELGARVGLPRLYLESNSNFKKRILDVSQNPDSGSMEGFKRTLRRELDLWRAYGSTPDSNYLGATPEVLEITDIEKSTPYFDENLKPQKAFRDLISKINTQYPSNIGYVRWGEGVWDYGGFKSEGISRIHSVYDEQSSPLGSYYQPGVGDFNDAKLEIVNAVANVDEETFVTDFSGYVTISGTEISGQNYSYDPIIVDYSFFSSYLRNEIGKDAYGAVLAYEIDMPAHDNYSTPSTFYANISYEDYPSLHVKNLYPESSSASPEFILFSVIDQDGLTTNSIIFKDKVYDEQYLNIESTPNSNRLNISTAEEVRVVLGQSWDHSSQAYVTENYGDFRFSFSLATPNFYSSFSPGDEVSLATPQINVVNSNLFIGSEYYGSTPNRYFTSSYKSSLILNDSNSLDSSSATPKVIDIESTKDRILYPSNATPEYIYYTVSDQSLYGSFVAATPDSVIGGYSKFHGNQINYFVPSSPNILYTVYDDSSGITQAQDFFESATVDYSSSDRYIHVESDSSAYYPFEYETQSDFTASTAAKTFEGFIDEYGNTYEASETVENTIYIGDKVIGEYDFSLNSFGMSSSGNFTVERVSFTSATPGVKIYVDDTSDFISGLNQAFADDDTLSYSISARKEESYGVSLHPGFIHYNEEDWYIYKSPQTQSENGRFFNLELDKTPNASKPVMVTVDGQDWRQVVFEDSATPGKISFRNTESIEYISGNKLNLAYSDVSDIEVADTYSGKVVNDTVSESNAVIYPFDSATPGQVGRYYDVSYLVNNSFAIDPDVFESEQYKSYIYFSSTPSSNVDYEITYESSLKDDYNYVDLDIDQYENPLSEGFVFVSDKDFAFGSIGYRLSPSYLYDNTDDFMNLTIISYDENRNLKPGQTFRVHGSSITSIPEYVTTNDNGLGTAKVYYSGSIPANSNSDTFTIQGIGAATPNGGLNSVSEGYVDELSFEILSENYYSLEVKAIPLRMQVEANATDDVIIYGQVYWRGYPVSFEVDIDWYVADYVADLFNGNYSATTITTNSSGRFIIQNAITAKPANDPGIRFVRVDLNDPSAVVSELQSQGETIESNNVTISGDIVYWNETFDNIEFFNDNVRMPRDLRIIPDENYLLMQNPSFRYSHTNPSIIRYSQTTLAWTTERWVPMTRYQQYQLGLFGSTPNTISTYANMHPDYGDS
jgi:hypothetical protein